MKHPAATAVLVALLALATPVFAQEHPIFSDPENPGCLADHAQERIIAFLQLTPDQVADWDVLIEERELAAEPIREAIRQVQEEMKAESQRSGEELSRKLAAEAAEAEQRVQAAKDQALAQLGDTVAEVVTSATAKLIGERPSDEQVTRAVRAATGGQG